MPGFFGYISSVFSGGVDENEQELTTISTRTKELTPFALHSIALKIMSFLVSYADEQDIETLAQLRAVNSIFKERIDSDTHEVLLRILRLQMRWPQAGTKLTIDHFIRGAALQITTEAEGGRASPQTDVEDGDDETFRHAADRETIQFERVERLQRAFLEWQRMLDEGVLITDLTAIVEEFPIPHFMDFSRYLNGHYSTYLFYSGALLFSIAFAASVFIGVYLLAKDHEHASKIFRLQHEHDNYQYLPAIRLPELFDFSYLSSLAARFVHCNTPLTYTCSFFVMSLNTLGCNMTTQVSQAPMCTDSTFLNVASSKDFDWVTFNYSIEYNYTMQSGQCSQGNAVRAMQSGQCSYSFNLAGRELTSYRQELSAPSSIEWMLSNLSAKLASEYPVFKPVYNAIYPRMSDSALAEKIAAVKAPFNRGVMAVEIAGCIAALGLLLVGAGKLAEVHAARQYATERDNSDTMHRRRKQHLATDTLGICRMLHAHHLRRQASVEAAEAAVVMFPDLERPQQQEADTSASTGPVEQEIVVRKSGPATATLIIFKEKYNAHINSGIFRIIT